MRSSRIEPREMTEIALEKWGEDKKKSERGGGEKQRKRWIFLCFSPPPSRFFVLAPTFRALSHLSRFDSRRDDLLRRRGDYSQSRFWLFRCCYNVVSCSIATLIRRLIYFTNVRELKGSYSVFKARTEFKCLKARKLEDVG